MPLYHKQAFISLSIMSSLVLLYLWFSITQFSSPQIVMAWKPQYVLNSEKSSWDPKLNSAHPSPQCAHRRVGMPEAWRKIKPNMECKDE